MTDRAARTVGLTTVVAQCRPHAVHGHSWTVGGAGGGCPPGAVPHSGQVSPLPVGSVAVDG
jgi:hypothetical protein